MPFEFRQNGDQGVLTLEGDMTIDQAGELRSLLLESMEKVDRIMIDAAGVEEIDLACFQVFLSAYRFFGENGKNFFLSPESVGTFQQAAARACPTGEEAGGLGLKTECLMEKD